LRINFKKILKNASLPRYIHATDAAFDFNSINEESINSGEIKAISTGLAWQPRKSLFNKYYLKIEGRSGLALQGILVLGGVIDSDYRKEIKVILTNVSRYEVTLSAGARIAQGIVYKIPKVKIKEVGELGLTERGDGFGSTGV
jgi:dUTP pyrophosphatase